jgi:hypothetical protein
LDIFSSRFERLQPREPVAVKEFVASVAKGTASGLAPDDTFSADRASGQTPSQTAASLMGYDRLLIADK